MCLGPAYLGTFCLNNAPFKGPKLSDFLVTFDYKAGLNDNETL